MTEHIALNLDQTLELIHAYVVEHNLNEAHVNEILKIVYHECSPGRQYQPPNVLYDQSLVQETLNKIRLE